jgi:hypothetical protein
MPSTANLKYEISPPTELNPHCVQQYAVTTCQNYFVVRFKLQNKSGVGRGSSVGVETCYVLDGPRFDTRWMRDFLQQSTTALGAHPTSRTVGVSTWIVPKLSGVSQCIGPSVALINLPYLTVMLKNEYSYAFTPSLVLHVLSWGGDLFFFAMEAAWSLPTHKFIPAEELPYILDSNPHHFAVSEG